MKSLFASVIVILFTAVCVMAQTSSFKNEFGFRSENDSYLAYGQDRYYTNGLSIYFKRAIDQSKLNGKLNKVIWEAEAGQKMYNAQSGYVPEIKYIDRPFAGYLYLGGGVNFLFNSENSLKINLHAGTIGPNARGKEVQELLHNLVGFYEINGWQWQIKNEAALNASANYKHFLFRNKASKLDLAVESYLNIGNTFAGAGTGFMFRTGSLNQLFQSASTESTVSNNNRTKALTEREFFFYAKPIIHYVAYDATIQGGLFNDEQETIVFDVKPVVFSQQAGLIYSKNRWTVDFSLIFKSREVKSSARPHQYGSASLNYRFN